MNPFSQSYIHAELEGLKSQAAELAKKISENFRKLGI